MTAAPSESLMDRVSRAVELNPGTTKTGITRLVKGTKQDVLRAIDVLVTTGHVQSTPGERAPTMVSVRPYRSNKPVCDNHEETGDESNGKLPGGLVCATDGKPVGNHGGSRQTASAIPDKSGEVLPTANGGEPAPFSEPRCRVCRHPPARRWVNELLCNGWTTAAVIGNLAAINADLPPKSRITKHCVHVHRERHLKKQVPVAAIWRDFLEAQARENASLAVNLLTPAAYLTAVMTKAFAAVTAEGAQVGVSEGIAAAREVAKVLAHTDDDERWARVHSQQARILDAFKTLPPEFRRQVLAKLDGEPWPPPAPGPARLALVEATPVGEFDPFDEDEDLEDDDD